MTDFTQLSPEEKGNTCRRVHRAIQGADVALSAVGLMHRTALPLSTVCSALEAMLSRGAVQRTEPAGNAPELWSVVPRKAAPR